MRDEHAGGTVFIVNEDDAMRDSLRAMFEARGYRTISYTDVSEFDARPALASGGCLIMDLSERGPGGLEFLQSVSNGDARLPVVVLCDAHSHDLKIRALQSGAATCIDKPFEPDDLVAALHKALRSAS